MVDDGRPLLPEILAETCPLQKHQLPVYIFCSASAITSREKVQLT